MRYRGEGAAGWTGGGDRDLRRFPEGRRRSCFRTPSATLYDGQLFGEGKVKEAVVNGPIDAKLFAKPE